MQCTHAFIDSFECKTKPSTCLSVCFGVCVSVFICVPDICCVRVYICRNSVDVRALCALCMCVHMFMHARKHACSGIVVAACASLCVYVSGEGSLYLFVCEESVNTKLVRDRCDYYLFNTCTS